MRFNRLARTLSAGVTSTNTNTTLPLYVGPYSARQADFTGEAQNDSFNNVNAGPIAIHVWNTGANSIDFRVIASNDDTLAETLWVDLSLSLTAVGTGAAKMATIAQPGYAFLRVQVKATAGGAQGTAHCVISQRGFE